MATCHPWELEKAARVPFQQLDDVLLLERRDGGDCFERNFRRSADSVVAGAASPKAKVKQLEMPREVANQKGQICWSLEVHSFHSSAYPLQFWMLDVLMACWAGDLVAHHPPQGRADVRQLRVRSAVARLSAGLLPLDVVVPA